MWEDETEKKKRKERFKEEGKRNVGRLQGRKKEGETKQKDLREREISKALWEDEAERKTRKERCKEEGKKKRREAARKEERKEKQNRRNYDKEG